MELKSYVTFTIFFTIYFKLFNIYVEVVTNETSFTLQGHVIPLNLLTYHFLSSTLFHFKKHYHDKLLI